MNRQLLLNVLPVPIPTLENYIIGPNYEALHAIQTLKPGRAIYLWGSPGCGRSHLLRALSKKLNTIYINTENQISVLYKLMNQYNLKDSFPKLIAIDDVDLFSQDSLSKIFSLYNQWYDLSATKYAFSLAVSGKSSPLYLSIREDLRTRLAWDLVFQLKPLSDSEKSEALAAQTAERGLQKKPEVINWMLTHYDRDIRKLMALLDALDRYSLSTGRHITIPLLRSMLANPELYIL
ncbi:MAG: DnaA regulatory inactivator Hda [Bordetella sp.]|nr:MAG: DnaA regulatory inactivator Hda [Bordetella sp.]